MILKTIADDIHLHGHGLAICPPLTGQWPVACPLINGSAVTIDPSPTATFPYRHNARSATHVDPIWANHMPVVRIRDYPNRSREARAMQLGVSYPPSWEARA